MSYEIVKSIKTKDKRVYVKSESNNVYPKTYDWDEAPYLTRILQEKGKNALELELLEAYETGNFQAGNQNKYTRALKVLRHLPEYQKFDWRKNENADIDNEEYRNLLQKALTTQLPKQKYMIVKEIYGKMVYFYHRKNANYCHWFYKKGKGKLFDYKEDAKLTKKCFISSDDWKIIRA